MKRFVLTLCALAMLQTVAFAANKLDNSNNPADGSGMPTLLGIYQQLFDGTPATRSSAFLEPAAGPAGTGKTLAEIQAVLPVPDNTRGAAITDVLSGKTFWGLLSGGGWGLQTGSYTPPAAPTGTAVAADVLTGKTFSNATGVGISGGMPNNGAVTITPGTFAQTIAAGYHNGSGTVAGDANLTAANIKFGATIFGITGTLAVKRVNKTGQTISYVTGDDGQYQNGLDPAVVPTAGTTGSYNTPSYTGSASRFIDNGNGTVTDNMTALIWQQYAYSSDMTWADALGACNTLKGGDPNLNDGSSAGQWRLPNINELHSLGPTWPLVAPFVNNLASKYWSSTTSAYYTDVAWDVNFSNGFVDNYHKFNTFYVRCVRGGQ
jgi:hypothetical protein